MLIKMDPVHRNSDGTINFDYYRRQGVFLRREAQRLTLLELGRMVSTAFASATRFERKAFASDRPPKLRSNETL